jgi:glutathione reductase (NADPH)
LSQIDHPHRPLVVYPAATRFQLTLSERNLDKEHVDYHEGWASFIDDHTIEIEQADGQKYQVKAKKICVTVGGRPTIPSDDKIPGASYGIDSDGFFDIEEQPKRVAVVGAGYISVELAGVFNTLGTETHLIIRHDAVLRTFDPVLSETLMPYMGELSFKLSLLASQ